MATKIIWTESALQDLEQIAAFIATDSPHYASLTVSRIVGKVETLQDFPKSGRIVPEFEDQNLREVLWRSYRIVYRLEGPTVAIVTVSHGSRPLPPDLTVS